MNETVTLDNKQYKLRVEQVSRSYIRLELVDPASDMYRWEYLDLKKVFEEAFLKQVRSK